MNFEPGQSTRKHKLLPQKPPSWRRARPRARTSIITLQPRHLAAAAAQVRALKLELGPELRHLGHRRRQHLLGVALFGGRRGKRSVVRRAHATRRAEAGRAQRAGGRGQQRGPSLLLLGPNAKNASPSSSCS